MRLVSFLIAMKYSEFTKIAQRMSRDYHVPIEDVEFEVSLWPEETPAEDGIRYFGEIHELMENHGSVMILADGKRNIEANSPVLTRSKANTKNKGLTMDDENKKDDQVAARKAELATTPCYAVFHGKGGYDHERKRAVETFRVGEKYRITGGREDRFHTDLEFEGVPGRWNSVLFAYDEDAAPIETPYRHNSPLLSAPICSEPLRIVMSREEIEDKAKAYLLEYVDGKPNDDFYLRLGMMVDFSHFLFQNGKDHS